MSNPWFKFYAQDYLNEPKLKGADADKRSCLVTALCYSATNEGRIDTRYLTVDVLKLDAGIPVGGERWGQVGDFYQWLIEREMGYLDGNCFIFKNWERRQDSFLTEAERSKRYRDKQRDGHVTNVTLEKNRIEENREEKREEKPYTHLEYLTKIPDSDLKELSGKYEASPRQIQRKGEQMANYCHAKGKVYKNYRAFLENGLDKDFGRRAPQKASPVVEKVTLTPEQEARVAATKAEISKMFKVKP